MPADYKHISTGRVKALNMATSDLRRLYKDLVASKVIAPTVIERFKVINALMARASGVSLYHDQMEILEKLLGKD